MVKRGFRNKVIFYLLLSQNFLTFAVPSGTRGDKNKITRPVLFRFCIIAEARCGGDISSLKIDDHVAQQLPHWGIAVDLRFTINPVRAVQYINTDDPV